MGDCVPHRWATVCLTGKHRCIEASYRGVINIHHAKGDKNWSREPTLDTSKPY